MNSIFLLPLVIKGSSVVMKGLLSYLLFQREAERGIGSSSESPIVSSTISLCFSDTLGD
jgi:hypothetical protein